jgi:hypothetical protein
MTEASTWRWVVFIVFIVFFVLFPILFHPWWAAVLSVVVFGLLLWILFPGKSESK